MGRKVIGERQLETSSSWGSQLWDCPTAEEKEKERKKKETHQKNLDCQRNQQGNICTLHSISFLEASYEREKERFSKSSI